jgi:phenylacetate-CoA ligase
MLEALEFAGLLRRKTWPRERLDSLRRVKLQRLIAHAYERVPYYRRLMDQAGVTPANIREPADLRIIPITTKADLRRAGQDCLSAGIEASIVQHTSGHSGVPFEVHMTSAEARTRRLREFRMLIGIGVRPRDRLTLLGPVRTRPKRLHRALGFYRMEVIPLLLAPEEQLRRFRLARPDVLWAYPSALQTVLHHAGCGLRGLARPRFLINSSAVMTPLFCERLLAEMPEMEIVNVYGSAEAGRIAAECRSRRGLHVEDDAIILELLENGSPVARGREGTAVVTCLDQLAMPLIRYEQGDICRERLESCACGWQTPVLDRPIGRQSDMLTLPGGAKVSADRIDVSLRHETDLLQYRFVQDRLDRIQAQLCFRCPQTPAKLADLQRRMEEAAGDGMTVDIELVTEPKFDSVKFKVFVSKL